MTTYRRDPTTHRVLQATDPAGNQETWTYGTYGSNPDVLLTHTDLLGLTTRFEYDGSRRVTKATSGQANFDVNGNFVSFVTPNNLLAVTTYVYGSAGFGNPTSIVTADGSGNTFVTTTDVYDAQNRLLSETLDDSLYSSDAIATSTFDYNKKKRTPIF